MKNQLDNKLVTSFLLMMDHEVQKQGEAFSNKTGLFYKDEDKVYQQYSYTCSYKQLCNDTSISGANIMSGVYVSGVYTPVGSGGLISINHNNGCVNFNHLIPSGITISGSFAVKDFSIYLSDQPDYAVIMDSKFHSNPKYAQNATGISQDTKTMPAIILVPKDQEARPLAFGGIDDNFIRLRAMVVCENAFQRVAVCNILKNFRLKTLPLFNNVPFDYLGNMTGINYNYSNLTFYGSYFPYILTAKAIQIPNQGSFTEPTRQFAMVDFDVSAWGGHQ